MTENGSAPLPEDFPTTAIVLAGGLGTRLRDVVRDVPKPLAPIGDRPFLAHLLDGLARRGIRHVIFATGHLGHLVEEAFGHTYAGMDLRYSRERAPLGTGGAVALALGLHNSTDDVWVLNGDTYFDCPLADVAQTHRDARADVTLALHREPRADRYGLVELDDDGLVTAFREKTPGASGLINAGVYLLDPEALQRFDFPEAFSLERDFFERHLDDLRLVGSPQEGAYFVDIGVPDDYARARRYFAR